MWIILKLWLWGFPFRLPGSGSHKAAEPRLVRLKRIQVELGVQICGGNLYGIFVESVDEDSPAKSPDGLLPGDLLLEVPAVFIDQYNTTWSANVSTFWTWMQQWWPQDALCTKYSDWTKKCFSSSTVKDCVKKSAPSLLFLQLFVLFFFLPCLFDFYWKRWVTLCWQPSSVSCCQLCNWCFSNSTMASAWRIKQKKRPTWKCWNQLKQSHSRCRTVWIALMWSKSLPEMDFL